VSVESPYANRQLDKRTRRKDGREMRERLERRLQELKDEFGKGQQTLEGLEAQAAEVRQTLLRISGAIQVLEELGHTDQDHVADGHEPPVEGARETGTASGLAGRPGT
jgi:uncharacterized coiled-coil protein SlyX